MTPKVIAFNGSPRKDGNTAHLLRVVLAELEKNGIATEEIHVGAKQIQGCLGCMQCYVHKNKHCVLKNDPVNAWIDKMIAADGIILGSPVYCADLSGQIKTFMDRTSLVACANDWMFKRKVGAAVVAVRRAGAVHTFHSLNAYFNIAQMVVAGSSYWNMGFGRDPGEVLKDAEGMQTMRNLGLNMAWLLKSIKYAKNAILEPDTRVLTHTNMIRDDLQE
ncbi:MAG: flavodoxin family protein [Gammaproteobacteria bacterium]|nr:flavodoxin family protein [Gammaproteobacteria bacterium]